VSPLEAEGRQLLAGLADFLRACGAYDEAAAHLEAITQIVRPRVFSAAVVGEGDIRINPQMLFGLNGKDLLARLEYDLPDPVAAPAGAGMGEHEEWEDDH
jgi:hypothetical protein